MKQGAHETYGLFPQAGAALVPANDDQPVPDVDMVIRIWRDQKAIAVLPLGLLAAASVGWKRNSGSLSLRVYLSLSTVAAIGYVLLLHYWNLVGFRY